MKSNKSSQAKLQKLKKNKIKTLLYLIILGFSSNHGLSQTLLDGVYSSSDLGSTYSITIKQEGNIIKVTEPNRISRYVKSDENVYHHSEAKYAHFYLRVTANNKVYVGKNGGSEQLFKLIKETSTTTETLPSGIDNCPLYDKYLKLSKTDETEVQAWSFCGAAALAKCTYTETKSYLEPLIKALKSILVNPAECPCTDAITQNEWAAVKID